MNAGMTPCLQQWIKILAVRVSGTQGPQEIRVRGTQGLQTGPRCMGTTIRRDISSPSTSGNNSRLSYIWMYVRWDIYRDTYLDIWVRRVIIISGTFCNSCYACYDFLYVPLSCHVTCSCYDSCYSFYICYAFLL